MCQKQRLGEFTIAAKGMGPIEATKSPLAGARPFDVYYLYFIIIHADDEWEDVKKPPGNAPQVW